MTYKPKGATSKHIYFVEYYDDEINTIDKNGIVTVLCKSKNECIAVCMKAIMSGKDSDPYIQQYNKRQRTWYCVFKQNKWHDQISARISLVNADHWLERFADHTIVFNSEGEENEQ